MGWLRSELIDDLTVPGMDKGPTIYADATGSGRRQLEQWSVWINDVYSANRHAGRSPEDVRLPGHPRGPRAADGLKAIAFDVDVDEVYLLDGRRGPVCLHCFGRARSRLSLIGTNAPLTRRWGG